jgi:hypothetical protein
MAQTDMPYPLPTRVAWQGLSLRLPSESEVAGTYGAWRSGYLLTAKERRPQLSVTWKRERLVPDLGRTLRQAVKRLRKDAHGAQAVADEAAGDNGLLRRFTTTAGDRIVAARHFADAGMTVIWRQLGAMEPRELAESIRAAEALPVDAAWPWTIHGLDCTLPPWWRCEGVQALAGLSRGVWMRYERDRVSPDQVMVLRRMACANRVLGGRSLADWLRASLHGKETVGETPRHDGVCELHCSAPALTLWGRLRGQRQERRLLAWVDAESDRLTVQEWTGRGAPLPCLRHQPSAHGVPLLAGAP